MSIAIKTMNMALSFVAANSETSLCMPIDAYTADSVIAQASRVTELADEEIAWIRGTYHAINVAREQNDDGYMLQLVMLGLAAQNHA
jgi:hypothetical protein